MQDKVPNITMYLHLTATNFFDLLRKTHFSKLPVLEAPPDWATLTSLAKKSIESLITRRSLQKLASVELRIIHIILN